MHSLRALPFFVSDLFGNGEQERDSPRGRIYLMRAVQDGRLPLEDAAVKHFDLCLGCRACEAACPSGVQYGDLLEHTRDHVEKHYDRSVFQRFLRRVVIEKIFPFPNRMKLALWPARLINGLRLDGLLPKFAREALSLIPSDLACGCFAGTFSRDGASTGESRVYTRGWDECDVRADEH